MSAEAPGCPACADLRSTYGAIASHRPQVAAALVSAGVVMGVLVGVRDGDVRRGLVIGVVAGLILSLSLFAVRNPVCEDCLRRCPSCHGEDTVDQAAGGIGAALVPVTTAIGAVVGGVAVALMDVVGASWGAGGTGASWIPGVLLGAALGYGFGTLQSRRLARPSLFSRSLACRTCGHTWTRAR